jgi:hypothetical protein
MALDKGAAYTTNHAGTMTNTPPPFTISTNPGCMQLLEVFKEHPTIGWIHVFNGHLSMWWHNYVASHLKSAKSRLKAHECAAKFVTALWEHTLHIWKYRNYAFHADNEAHKKQYKLEALVPSLVWSILLIYTLTSISTISTCFIGYKNHKSGYFLLKNEYV